MDKLAAQEAQRRSEGPAREECFMLRETAGPVPSLLGVGTGNRKQVRGWDKMPRAREARGARASKIMVSPRSTKLSF